jgi:hypothetical protein
MKAPCCLCVPFLTILSNVKISQINKDTRNNRKSVGRGVLYAVRVIWRN